MTDNRPRKPGPPRIIESPDEGPRGRASKPAGSEKGGQEALGKTTERNLNRVDTVVEAIKRLEASRDSPFEEISHPKKRAFLCAYSQLGSKQRAAQVAGISHGTIYTPQWRDDPQFQEALERARQMAVDVLEDEAYRWAVEGVEEPVGWYKGVAGGTVRRYSDTLLIFKLKGEAPEKIR